MFLIKHSRNLKGLGFVIYLHLMLLLTQQILPLHPLYTFVGMELQSFLLSSPTCHNLF